MILFRIMTMMEYWPNSRPEDIGPDWYINFPLTECIMVQRTTVNWDGPRNISYNRNATGLSSYVNWPQHPFKNIKL